MNTIQWGIPRVSGDSINLTLQRGDQLFIIGANGSGKSALIQRFVSEARNLKVKRISAHRQTWFDSGSINFTPERRERHESDSRNFNSSYEARWKDSNPSNSLSAILFDLVARENTINKTIAHYVRNQNIPKAQSTSAESPSVFDQINELLNLGTLTVKLENFNDRQLLARHGTGETFSIAEMSDGERNAMIIAAHVITAEPGTALLIDEPERHLHRSIIQPFLSALFALRREDCTFIIATHEMTLPIANSEARVLILRSCQWQGNQCVAWDAEVLEPDSELPDELKLTILGSRRRILFVEGGSGSLDISLYTALFSDISVVSKGSCEEVQKAVLGLHSSQDFHHVAAFGLIDRDNRTDEDVEKLAENGIFALEVYSVEALYYCSDAIAAVARRQAESLGADADGLIKLTKRKMLEVLEDEQLAETMAARRCERQIQELALSEIPTWKSIKGNPPQEIRIPIDTISYSEELARFKELVKTEDLDQLISRYPLCDSCTFQTIAQSLRCPGRKDYERMVLVQMRND
jgi:ABC-type ATPase involved in cell division